MVTKSMIVPIVAVLALAVQAIFGISVDEATQTQIVDTIVSVVAVGLTIKGIIENHIKEESEKEEKPVL